MKINKKTGGQIIRALGFLAILFWCLPSLSAADTQLSNSVAVLDFSVPTAERNRWAWAEGGVADLLQIELQQQGLLLLDRDEIHAVLAEQRLATTGWTAENNLAVAKLLNAQFLIIGKVIPLAGERFRVEVSVFSVETVETAVSAVGEGNFPQDLSQVVQQVAKQITKKLPAHSGLANETRPAIRAPKPEALIMFYRGLNACAAGQPEWGAAYFINSASLDPDFTVPLLWEIKAYEMAGLSELANLRRQELVPLLGTNAAVTPAVPTNNETLRPVLALLDPVFSPPSGAYDAAALAGEIKQSLLTDNRVRVFAYEGIGAAVAEQDLRLSSLFSGQNAPRYGRWLTADALLFCHVKPAETGGVEIELSLINSVNASVMAHIQQVQPSTSLLGTIPNLTHELLSTWLNHPMTTSVTMTNLETATAITESENPDLRPLYHDVASALNLARREPEKSDSHRALANAFGAVGRTRLAAYEIEQCLKELDIHAPHADTIFLGTHRWLFWEPSPASGAVGFVNQQLIDHLIEQLLTSYPNTLAAGCMHYNLAVTAWRTEKWVDAITQAEQCRQTMEPIIAQYDRKNQSINGGECDCEMVAATYFLEGASLGKLGKQEAAKLVFHQGLDFMQSFKVRNFCLPYGPYIGDFFGPQRVYGYGGDAPGIQTRLQAELAKLGENIEPRQPESPPVVVTKGPGADWIQKGQLEIQKGNYPQALECYQKAVTAGAAVKDCPGLAAALLEIALDRNISHPREEIEKLRRQFGFPLVEASWVEWFEAGRRYQAGQQFNYPKAVACYSGTLEFLRQPEEMGYYHLEKLPNTERTALKWGPTLTEIDLLWSQNYNERWCNAAFYLAESLIKTDQKEEAAQWLRQIALKEGGETIVLLTSVNWNGGSGQEVQIGVRAAELLQTLHQDEDRLEFGQSDGPYKVPPMEIRARPMSAPVLPPVEDGILPALTNALAEAALESSQQSRTLRLQALVEQYGHELVPAGLTLLARDGALRDEGSLVWILENTATAADAPWVVDACTRHWRLITLSEKLDPAATATALAEVWQGYAGEKLIPPSLIREIIRARVRPIYALVLQQVAEKKVNHHTDIFEMDKVVSEEKSDELEAGFREALARCLKLKLLQQDTYELRRISQVALRHGVSEGIDGVLVADAADLKSLRADLGSVIELPEKDEELVAFLKASQSRWEWDSQHKTFQNLALKSAHD